MVGVGESGERDQSAPTQAAPVGFGSDRVSASWLSVLCTDAPSILHTLSILGVPSTVRTPSTGSTGSTGGRNTASIGSMSSTEGPNTASTGSMSSTNTASTGVFAVSNPEILGV